MRRAFQRVHHTERISHVHAQNVITSATRGVNKISIDAPSNLRDAAAARGPTARATALRARVVPQVYTSEGLATREIDGKSWKELADAVAKSAKKKFAIEDGDGLNWPK